MLPKAITEQSIPIPPKNGYEGYLYRFTNLEKKKKYVGVHKGEFGDGYWNSATSSEMQKDLSSKGANFKYEILNYGNYDLMTVKEHEILTADDAITNNLYYNKSNGSPKYKTMRVPLLQEIVSRARDGEFPISKELAEVLVKMDRVQVRFEDMSKHQLEISQKVDDNLGNTDEYFCVVLVNRLYEGERSDRRIDGNHSVYGIDDSKHGTDINVIRIPESVHKKLNDAEVKALGNMFNKKPVRPLSPVNEDDAVKSLVDTYEKLGTPAMEKTNKDYLVALGFSKRKAGSLQRKAKKEIDTIIEAAGGKVWIDWNAAPHKGMLESFMEQERNANTIVLRCSSGLFRNDRILAEVYNTQQLLKDTKVAMKKEVIVIITHPSLPYFNDWKSHDEQYNRNFITYFLKPLGISFQFKDMDTHRKDTEI